MSTTFTEFLREKAAKQAAQLKASGVDIEEWRGAVERLFAQLRAWLAQSDPDGIIRIEEGKEKINEPGLGRYVVPRLDLYVLDKWIGIIPKARKTVLTAHPPLRPAPERAIGRVDITDELRRYILSRFPRLDGQGDMWFIEDVTVGTPPRPLDQAKFEEALMSYLV